MTLPENAVLIIVDVQKGFDDPGWGRRNSPHAEKNITRLLQAWRRVGRPVVHVQHLSQHETSPLHPTRAGCAIKDCVAPQEDEPVFQKRVNSAFIGTALEEYLCEDGYDTLVITGLTTNHCVSTTVRMAGNLGFDTYVVADATAAFGHADHKGRHHRAEDIHAVSLANLHDEFAAVVHTEAVLTAAKAVSDV